jgi:hypothetical protein
MTSLVATNGIPQTPITKNRFLKVNKEGVPLTLQVPRTAQINTAVGPATLTFDGSNDVWVTNALTGAITFNATSVNNLIGRAITIFVRGGVGQNVVVNFPAAGYPVYLKGGGAVTTQTIAANANAQNITIVFGPTAGYIIN